MDREDYYNNLYLAHHGIKGQKWGVRRYQNADGTYTEEGKKRYFDSDGNLNDKGKKFEAKQSINSAINAGAFSSQAAKEEYLKAAALVGAKKANKMLNSKFASQKLGLAGIAAAATLGVGAVAALSGRIYFMVPVGAIAGAVTGISSVNNEEKAVKEAIGYRRGKLR